MAKYVIFVLFKNYIANPSKASLYGEDLCLTASNFPNTNDDTKIHGSKEENTCKDTIHLKVKGVEKHALSTTHMAITLSNKNFYANPNTKLTLSLNTLIHEKLDHKLSQIQCGVSEDQENQARVSYKKNQGD